MKRKYGSRKSSKARKFRKRSIYRIKRKYKKSTKIHLAGVPQSQVVKFRYVDKFVLDAPNIDTITQQQFRAASIYDPDFSGTGTTVQNWAAYNVNYAHYQVLGSKITVRSINSQATSTYPCMWGIVLSRTTNTLGGTTTSKEILQSNGSFGGNNKFRTQGGINGMNAYLTRKFSARKFYNIPKKDSVFSYQGLHSLFAGNCSEEPTFTLWCSNVVSGSNPDPQVFHVTIDYITRVWEPRYQSSY